jgi:hypothetical protein
VCLGKRGSWSPLFRCLEEGMLLSTGNSYIGKPFHLLKYESK